MFQAAAHKIYQAPPITKDKLFSTTSKTVITQLKPVPTGYIASMPISVSVKNKTKVVIKLNPTPSEASKVDQQWKWP